MKHVNSMKAVNLFWFEKIVFNGSNGVSLIKITSAMLLYLMLFEYYITFLKNSKNGKIILKLKTSKSE